MPTADATFSSGQAEVVRLADLYRDCCLGQKYYACRLIGYKRLNFAMDLIVALTTSTSLAGLAILKTPVGANFFSLLLSASVLMAVIRPVLKISESIDQYSKLHYGYAQLFLAIEDLMVQIRRAGKVCSEHYKDSSEVFVKYRNLVLQDDPHPSMRLTKKCQEAVNRQIPADRIWLPEE